MAVSPLLTKVSRFCPPSVFVRGFRSSPLRKRSQQELTDYVKRETEKNWGSYGFYPTDRVQDKRTAHMVTGSIIFAIVSSGFILYYKRDNLRHDWYRREAFLVIRERENAGKLHISMDYVDPSKLELPTDEELGNASVII